MRKVLKGLMVIAAVLLTACGKEEAEETMRITGGQEYIYAPQEGTKAQTAPYTVIMGEADGGQTVSDVTWEILTSASGVSVSADGVVIIDDTYVAGDINGTDIVIQATVNGSDEAAKETVAATLHVREAERAASFDILLPDSIQAGTAAEISLANWANQYGEPMEAPHSEVEWAFSHEKLSVEEGQLQVRMKVGQEAFAAVCATVDGVSAEKRFIVTREENYEPSPEMLEKLALAEIIILREVDFTRVREVDTESYAYVRESLAGLETLAVDVSGMVNAGSHTQYQVAVRHGDGSVTIEDRKADADGIIRLALQDADAVEVSPVLRFCLGDCEPAEGQGAVQVAVTDQYTGQEAYGFYGQVANVAGGVSMRGTANSFVVALPDGFYSIKITKPMSGTGRSTVKINDASQGTNVGNQGTGGRTGVLPYTYLMEDVLIEGGTARISLDEKDYTLAAVEVRRTPQIVERRVHIYLGGDSTVSNYYPIEETEPQPGRFQTGWGQVFGQYVTEANVVTNLAGGGTYAKSWYEMAFPGVIQNAQPGDYFLIQAGINDRSYSNQEEMVEYLSRMIDQCREKDVIVILVTTMQSPKFWKDKDGNEVGEHGVPAGSGLAPFMDSIRQLAAEKEVFLVDTGKLTGEWYSQVGRTYVAQNYHIYNSETNVEEDTLHLSYHGALKIAELVATALAQMQTEGAADGRGNTLDGLSFHEMREYQFVCQDGAGEEISVKVTGVPAVYRRYGE